MDPFEDIGSDPHPAAGPWPCPVCQTVSYLAGLNCELCGQLDYDDKGNWFAVDPEYAAYVHSISGDTP